MKAISIIFQNQEILLVNKPCGVSVQGGKGISHPLDEELSKQLGYRIHLVHRLDKETEGILIVAKNPQAASKWTKLISTKEVQKEYKALCVGLPKLKGKTVKEGLVESEIEAHGRNQSARTFFSVEKTASVTVKKSLKVEGEDNPARVEEEVTIPVSLIDLKLGTGRMHQIRIQMAQLDCPLCGDDQHGNFKINKLLRKAGIKKLCLASTRLTIPLDGKKQTFEIPLPEHMEAFVKQYM